MSDEQRDRPGHSPGAAADGVPGGAILPFRVPANGRGNGRRAIPHDTEPDDDDADPSLAQSVAGLAAKGLDEEEIRMRLDLPDALDEAMEQVLADAFRRGQVLGRAYLKEAQFEAAVQGRVTAQARVLARLGEPAGEDGGAMDAAEADGLLPPGG